MTPPGVGRRKREISDKQVLPSRSGVPNSKLLLLRIIENYKTDAYHFRSG